MNKTISINPDLFSFSSSKRASQKKKNHKEQTQAIKIKPHKDKNKQVRKQHILRFLRRKQEDNYKKLLEGDTSRQPKTQVYEPFNSDFDESLKFLKDVTESNDNKHNFTSKNRNSNIASVSSILTPIDIKTDDLETNHLSLSKPTIINASTPSWGCLKNGDLPTFRDWKKSTQKNYSLGINDNKREISSMMKMKAASSQPKLNYMKQRKTVKRTYKVGKSTNISKVSVLISNKTIRNNIMDKTHTLKMRPIEEMKRFLIKKGFIRVGTSAPNDVIRKMYETANMVCGEIENHNADNLLFNYMNDIDIE